MSEQIGGYDVRFNIGTLPEGASIEIKSNVSIINDVNYPNSVLVLNKQADRIMILSGSERHLLSQCFEHLIAAFSSVRILAHDEFCTVYLDNAWVCTFSFEYISYPEELTLTMSYFDGTAASTGTCAVTNVIIQELYDWRDAIYIDLDTNAMNTIQSIIQQRPIEIVPRYDGVLQFYYEPTTRSNVSIPFIKDFLRTEEDSKTACSDAIVYYSDVKVLSNNLTAKVLGFITRIFRLSELDHGALKAAEMIQKKARQNTRRYKIQARINLALEVGDIADIEYTTVDTNETINDSFIAETIQLYLSNGDSYMIVEGRSNG